MAGLASPASADGQDELILDAGGQRPRIDPHEWGILSAFSAVVFGAFGLILPDVFLHPTVVVVFLFLVSAITFPTYILRYVVATAVWDQDNCWEQIGLSCLIGAAGVATVTFIPDPTAWFASYAALSFLAAAKERGTAKRIREHTGGRVIHPVVRREMELHEIDLSFIEVGQAVAWLAVSAIAALIRWHLLTGIDINTLLLTAGLIAICSVTPITMVKINRNASLVKVLLQQRSERWKRTLTAPGH